jgi:biotin carboxyl carrier protein
MKYTAIIDGDRLEIELTRTENGALEADVEGEKYIVDILSVERGVYWFQWKNRSIEISITPNADGYAVSVGGQRLEVEVIDARAALRKAARQGQSGIVELRAPMPGKVVKVLASEGTSVEMNQGLLIIEAMKMQNEIKSPKKGTVRKVGVKESAAVNAGDLLAIVE